MQVKLCGHGTLAAAHFLLTSGLVECDVIEFITESGLLTAKKAHGLQHQGAPNISFNGTVEKYSIELDFPVVPVVGYESAEFPSIPETLNGVSIKNVLKTTSDDLIVCALFLIIFVTLVSSFYVITIPQFVEFELFIFISQQKNPSSSFIFSLSLSLYFVGLG